MKSTSHSIELCDKSLGLQFITLGVDLDLSATGVIVRIGVHHTWTCDLVSKARVCNLGIYVWARSYQIIVSDLQTVILRVKLNFISTNQVQ